jgi:CheY-like chemotaxis protein
MTSTKQKHQHSPVSLHTILLVDDDPDCRLVLCDAIGQCQGKFNVVEKCSGAEALEYLKEHGDPGDAGRPSLIYLDVEMPGGIDGIETLSRIKSNVRLCDIPVVLLTGVSDDRQIKTAMTHGANSYTIKSADVDQFMRTVRISTLYWLTVHRFPQASREAEKVSA